MDLRWSVISNGVSSKQHWKQSLERSCFLSSSNGEDRALLCDPFKAGLHRSNMTAALIADLIEIDRLEGESRASEKDLSMHSTKPDTSLCTSRTPSLLPIRRPPSQDEDASRHWSMSVGDTNLPASVSSTTPLVIRASMTADSTLSSLPNQNNTRQELASSMSQPRRILERRHSDRVGFDRSPSETRSIDALYPRWHRKDSPVNGVLQQRIHRPTKKSPVNSVLQQRIPPWTTQFPDQKCNASGPQVLSKVLIPYRPINRAVCVNYDVPGEWIPVHRKSSRLRRENLENRAKQKAALIARYETFDDDDEPQPRGKYATPSRIFTRGRILIAVPITVKQEIVSPRQSVHATAPDAPSSAHDKPIHHHYHFEGCFNRTQFHGPVIFSDALPAALQESQEHSRGD